MTRQWRLTAIAEESLTNIARWTLHKFGVDQAAVYEQSLIDTCEGIAAGTVPSQVCRKILDPALPESLKISRAHQHFIIFIEDDQTVTIIDFLHRRRDVANKLKAALDL